MSYVQTVIDPLYTVRYSALGRLRYRDEPRKRRRKPKPIWVIPDVPGPEGYEIKPTRYGPPRPVRPPIRTRRLRKRPAPGLGSLSSFYEVVGEARRAVPTERVFKRLVPPTEPEVILPTEGEVPIVPDVTVEEAIYELVNKPRTFLEVVGEKIKVLPMREPATLVERVLDEVRRKAIPTLVERVLDEVRRKAIPIEIPAFEVDDAVIVGPPRKPFIKSKTRTEVVSVPVDKADATLAFQLAEAEKYGYTHAAWIALGIGGRGEVRRAYADRYEPVTPGGTPIDAATVEIIAGPDPLRQLIHDTGAGDYPGGLEFKTPDPNVRLKRTTAGLTFDDVLRIDPILIQTAEEAAGLVPTDIQKYATYGLMAVAAWILYDSLVKTKRPPPPRRRRRAPARGRSRRTRRR